MEKTNYEHVSLETFKKFKDLKIIIFDFDDTLYKYLDWKGYNEFFLNSVRNIFKELSDEKFEDLVKEYNLRNTDRVSEITAKMLLNLHGDTKELVDFLKTVEYPCDWKEGKIFPEEILRGLAKNYSLYIVSNSSEANIRFVSKNMKIDLSYFTEILPNNFDKEDLTKSFRLKEILNKAKCLPKNILMVGDSVKYDLEPALKLGMQVLLVED